MSKKVILTQGDIEYELGGRAGSWAKSREDRVEVGAVRFIGGIVMYAYTVYKRSLGKPEVNWCPTERMENEFHKLKAWVDSVN